MTNKDLGLAARLDDLVFQSELMLNAARESDWELVISTEKARRPELEAFFNAWHLRQEALDVDVVRRATEKMCQIDNEIKQLAENGRREVCESLSQLTSSKQAAKEYIKNSL